MKKFTIGLLMLAGIVLSSCSKEDDVPRPSEDIKRTVLMYVVADNDLSSTLYNGVDYMIRGVTPAILAENRLVVYIDGHGSSDVSAFPTLFEVRFNDNGVALKRVIEQYTEEVNSADAEVLGSVVERVVREFPSEGYGLILSSHALGWLPQNRQYSRSFGRDGSYEMNIPELAKALPDGQFDFIVFDACHMGAAEVAYELKDKTDVIWASPGETMAEGIPYHLVGAGLFNSSVPWSDLIDKYYDYYIAKTNVTARTVAQSLIRTANLEPLAQFTRSLLQNNWNGIANTPALSRDAQKFDYIEAEREVHRFLFDMGHFVKLYSPGDYDEFMALIEEVVPYYRHSDYILQNDSHQIKIDEYSGMAMYIPQARYTYLNNYYRTLAWYKAVYE